MSRQPTRIDTLSVEQLHQLGRQLEADLNRLNQTVGTIQGVATQYHQSGTAVEELKGAEEGELSCVQLLDSRHCYRRQS